MKQAAREKEHEDRLSARLRRKGYSDEEQSHMGKLGESGGPYELYNPKHPKFAANYKKYKAKNPNCKLEDFIAAMKKKEHGAKALGEKAVSKAQQKFMGMVYATKKGEKEPGAAVAKSAKGMTKKAAKDFASTKHKGLPQHVAESRNHESSEYTYETVGRILSEEQPHLDCNSEAFVKAVYDELIEMKMTPKAARW